MKRIYAKAVLYAYPHIDELIEQIDELKIKDALSSINDVSPAFTQCEKLVNLVFQEQTLAELKEMTARALEKFSQDEMDCLDYKYFKVKPKSYYACFDAKSRAYFRKQNRLILKVADKLERAGVTDEWFDFNCMSTYFFRDLVETVEEYEQMSYKNKRDVVYS